MLKKGIYKMLSKFTDKRKRDLLIATSLSFVFSVILRNVVYNALYKSGVLNTYFNSDDVSLFEIDTFYRSLFNIVSLALYILPPLFSIIFYNKSCDKSGSTDCKLSLPYYFFGLGIGLIGNSITNILFAFVYGILKSNESFQDKPLSDYTGLTPPSFYFVSFFICIALNFLFWHFHFKKNSNINNCYPYTGITIKDINKYSIIFSVVYLIFSFVSTYASGIQLSGFVNKRSANQTYSERMFDDFLSNAGFCIITIVCILLACLIYNALLKGKSQMKLKIFLYAFTLLAASDIGNLAGWVFKAFSSLIMNALYLNSPDVYEVLSDANIENILQFVIYLIIQVVFSFCFIKKYYMQKFCITGKTSTGSRSRSVPQEEYIYYFPTSAQPSNDDNQNNNYNSEI